ncbi:hypothetical protein JG687_00010112 [Phytophthora cactorum]|uniref:Uncharacterized protein n=1 Tax=Phytophthora cactorum TaxID=29920 RepID=A0A8T1UC22_9STRA|nr:hypothetical protein JG687_00010112 [Phytophthora cactorum]
MSNHSFQHRPPNPYAHEYQVQEDAPFEAHQILQVQCRQQKRIEAEAKPLKRAREYMPATNPLRPERTARTECIYSRSCKAELVVEENGTILSMCEEHKNYQASKLRERRAKMPARQFDPLQCQYLGGCKKERSIKLNGDRPWLCECHRECQNPSARARYRRSTSKKNRNARPHACHQVTIDALLPALF